MNCRTQPKSQRHQPQAAFTLLEFIVVILILGIITTSVTSYVRLGAGMYVDSTTTQQILSQSRFALERVVREVRGAVPGSIRVLSNGDNSISCVEFTPLALSGLYRDLPLYPQTRDWIGVTTVTTGWPATAGYRVVVYPTDSRHVYDLNQRRSAVVATLQNAPPDADGNANTERIQLDLISGVAPTFITESPQQRFFLAAQPVSFCVIGQQLRRYQNYGFQVGQSLPPSLTQSELMATGLFNQSTEPAFVLNTATLSRNAVLQIFWRFQPSTDLGQDLFFNHEVHIPNVP